MHRTIHHRAGRAVATATALLLGVALVPPVAGAVPIRGVAVGSESVTSGTWGVTASVTTMTFTNNTYQTSNATNSGTLALAAESYSVTVSNPVSGNPTFKVYQCAVAWAATKCSGGAGTQVGTGSLAKNSTTTLTSSTAMAVGAVLYLQVEPAAVTSSTTVTISTKIASTQLRAAVHTNQ